MATEQQLTKEELLFFQLTRIIFNLRVIAVFAALAFVGSWVNACDGAGF